MKNVSTLFHELNILWRRVLALSIRDGVHEMITELTRSAKEVGLDKVHHGVICSRRREREGKGKGREGGWEKGRERMDKRTREFLLVKFTRNAPSEEFKIFTNFE